MGVAWHERAAAGGAAAQVLVVEDDPSVLSLVALHLRRGGFRVTEAASAADGWAHVGQAHIVVLDRMLPGDSGDAFLRWLRASPEVGHLPVLLLTARATETDRVAGLEAGADDYLVKPFSAPELVARLRALLRRAPANDRVQVGELVVEVEAGRAFHGSSELTLTRREFQLLAHLCEHPGRVFSRGELLDRVWGEAFLGTERTVDQHVAQLRTRLGAPLIETVRGRGYRMVDPHARA